MGIYIVSRLYGKDCEYGYRLYNSANDRFEDWQTSRVIECLKYNSIKLENAILEGNGKLKGTTGVLENYPIINPELDRILGKDAFTIIGKMVEEGCAYKVVDGYGIVRRLSESQLINLSGKYGITNAVVVKNVKNPYIRAKGEFEKLGFYYEYLEKNFSTPNDKGLVKRWKVRIIKPGEPYGLDGCLTNDCKTLVEFISMDTCQFVSRYYLSTLLENSEDKIYGLNLNGSVRALSIEVESYKKILKWLRSLHL